MGLLTTVREPWLARGLIQHIARTGSASAVEALARASDPHVKFALDALYELLKAQNTSRSAATVTARLTARRPLWLPRLAKHPAARELARLARPGPAQPALDALLALVALVLAAPAATGPLWTELAETLARLVVWRAPPHLAEHLRLGLLALFRALYVAQPCALLDSLRVEVANRDDAFRRALLPLVRSVRLHPALLERRDLSRWESADPPDALDECRDYSLDDDREPPHTPPPDPNYAPPPVTASTLTAPSRPGDEHWFCLSERCGDESAPHTPLPAVEGSPPEAAVEATPENTPVKEVRAQFQFPVDTSCMRVSGRVSQPPSPLRKEASPPAAMAGGGDAYGARLARVVLERARESPVPMGGTPPTGPVARPLPRRPPEDVEDNSRSPFAAARALTARLRRLADPRRSPPPSKPPPRAPSLVRARSCPTLETAPSTRSVSAQTVDEWPAPHEYLIAGFFREAAESAIQTNDDGVHEAESAKPCERLDVFLERLYNGTPLVDGSDGETLLREQLALTHAQLMHERWRREAHAERNRRLLGRCRRARALELENVSLRDNLRHLTRERDELRSRRPAMHAAPASSAPSPAPVDEAAAARAAAALAAAEAGRLEAQEESRRLRAALAETSRRLERAEGAESRAERHAAAAKALRVELLLSTERETALRTSAAAAASAAALERRSDDRLLRQYRAEEARLRAAATAASHRAGLLAAREAELEAALGARESALSRAEASARAADERHAAQLQAVQDKYCAMMHVLRRAEMRRLEVSALQTVQPGLPSPPSRAPPELAADLRNLRDLLED